MKLDGTNYTHADSGGEALTFDKLKKVTREFYGVHGVDYDPQLAIKHGEDYARAARVIAQARSCHAHPDTWLHPLAQQLKEVCKLRERDTMLGGYTEIVWVDNRDMPLGKLLFVARNDKMTLLTLSGAPDAPVEYDPCPKMVQHCQSDDQCYHPNCNCPWSEKQ